MNPLARFLWWLYDAVIDDTDLDDWAPLIVGLTVAALFGAAIGIANQ